MNIKVFSGTTIAVLALACVPITAVAECDDGNWESEYTLELNEDVNYEGEFIRFRIFKADDEYKVDVLYLGKNKPNGWNDTISSVESNRETEWTMYKHSYCRGDTETGTGTDDSLSGFHDVTSSYRAELPPNYDTATFSVHVDSNQGGWELEYKFYRMPRSDNGVVFEIYALDDHWNDYVSSIQTGGRNAHEHDWYFYENNGYADQCLYLYNHGDDNNLTNNDNGGPCNDKITGMQLAVDETSPMIADDSSISAAPPDADFDGVLDDVDNCTDVVNPDQRDTNSDGFGNICDPDLNNDGIVNFIDVNLFKLAFFTPGDTDSDFNGDSQTNFIDLQVMKAYIFGPPGPAAQ